MNNNKSVKRKIILSLILGGTLDKTGRNQEKIKLRIIPFRSITPIIPFISTCYTNQKPFAIQQQSLLKFFYLLSCLSFCITY